MLGNAEEYQRIPGMLGDSEECSGWMGGGYLVTLASAEECWGMLRKLRNAGKYLGMLGRAGEGWGMLGNAKDSLGILGNVEEC